ncbi:hypothetical protein NC653_008610 [Populus alba x Populus x berolinensis]|uniref:Uncharacterized protein n=1 Tax=Populus alba x Populus x berolinensis TaxID=444605 RepID=A0AAD6R6T4_9ROSI|nr:hypothetical protein NC653_008610 [Populus alba x Populus x berolinensis]
MNRFGSSFLSDVVQTGLILFKGISVLRKTLCPLFAFERVLQLADLRWQPLINACGLVLCAH